MVKFFNSKFPYPRRIGLNIFLYVLFLLLLASIASGQEIIWNHTYESERSNSLFDVQQTTDGGYIAVGNIETSGSYSRQLLMIRTDGLGNAVWTKTYGGYGTEQGLSVKQTPDGGYVVVGNTTSYGSTFQVYLLRTNSLGDTLWAKTYGGSDYDVGSSVDLTADGGFIIAGWTYSYGAGNADVYLIKTDSLGEVEWTKTYGGVREDMAYHVEYTFDGGYVITGWTKSFSGMANSNMYLIKTDSLGDTLWTRAYFPYLTNTTYAYSAQQTSDSGYVLAGWNIDSNSGLCYFYLVKTDSQGDSLWTRTYLGAYLSWGESVKQTPDGGYVVVGFTQLPEYNYENRMFILKTTAEGDTEWTRLMRDDSLASGADAVALTSDGNYIIAGGVSRSFYEPGNSFLLKLTSSGQASLRGDLTGDEQVNIADVIYLVNYLFKGGSAPEQPLSADANCDGIVDLGDLIYLIDYLYKKGPKPGCLF
jgi:hypothetical protein